MFVRPWRKRWGQVFVFVATIAAVTITVNNGNASNNGNSGIEGDGVTDSDFAPKAKTTLFCEPI